MFDDIMWLINISQCGLVMEIWVIFCNVFKVVCGAPQIVNFTELVRKS